MVSKGGESYCGASPGQGPNYSQTVKGVAGGGGGGEEGGRFDALISSVQR